MIHDPLTTILLLLAAVAVLVIGDFAILRKRRARMAHRPSGTRSTKALNCQSGLSTGEHLLDAPVQPSKTLLIRPMPASTRAELSMRWSELQHEFLDDPKATVSRADQLATKVMKLQGYSTDDSDRTANFSAPQMAVIENYLNAHNIAVSHLPGAGTTGDMQDAMVGYRVVFNAFLGEFTARTTAIFRASELSKKTGHKRAS